jgi:hypothetical protein
MSTDRPAKESPRWRDGRGNIWNRSVSKDSQELTMMRVYQTLIRLYPEDVRFAYGEEMVIDFDRQVAAARQRGRLPLALFVAGSVLTLLSDASAERMNSLYSHRTFHTRCRPNPAEVRPPNMGKQEWFSRNEARP